MARASQTVALPQDFYFFFGGKFFSNFCAALLMFFVRFSGLTPSVDCLGCYSAPDEVLLVGIEDIQHKRTDFDGVCSRSHHPTGWPVPAAAPTWTVGPAGVEEGDLLFVFNAELDYENQIGLVIRGLGEPLPSVPT